MKYKVPFYGNTKDDTRCVQAVLRMVLKYFLPQRSFSWRELDRISQKEKNLGTWLVPALIWFAKNNFEIINIEKLDYRRLYKQGEGYIRKKFPKQVAEWYLEKSNLHSILRHIPEFIDRVKLENKYARIGEVRQLLDKGYLVASDINSAVLNNKTGYDSHLVLVVGCGMDYLILHDPGLPPYENRKVSIEVFSKAWSRKHGSGPNLTAFKLKK